MKYLFFFLSIYAVQAAIDDDNSVILGSVRDSRSGIPKCIGTFVTTDTLLTTAKCLFCDRDCELSVYMILPDGSSKKLGIDSMYLHEDYEMDPPRDDIGYIRLKDKVPESAVLEIPPLNMEVTKINVLSFRGKFEQNKYYFRSNVVKVISNAKCSYTLAYYIPTRELCAYSPSTFFFKEQDQGTPLVYTNKGKKYLVGMLVSSSTMEYEEGARIVIYQSIPHYSEWINLEVKNTSSCAPIEPPTTAAPTTTTTITTTAEPTTTEPATTKPTTTEPTTTEPATTKPTTTEPTTTEPTTTEPTTTEPTTTEPTTTEPTTTEPTTTEPTTTETTTTEPTTTIDPGNIILK